MISAKISHKSDNWATPKALYQAFMDKGFYDPCPLDPNGCDALLKGWPSKVFVNPPYSDIMPFVDRALGIALKDDDADIWLLLPCNTGTKWFGLLVENTADMFFLRGRLKFGDSVNSAPFYSVLVHLYKSMPGLFFSCTMEDFCKML